MVLRFSFFRTPKHKVFTYRPLYYDPVKEELEERVTRIKDDMDKEKSRLREKRLTVPGRRIRGSFQKALYENRRHAGDNKFVRLVTILAIIALLIAVVYFADGLAFFFRSFSSQTTP